MTEKNKELIDKLTSNKTVNKLVTSAAIFALLAPSFSGVAAVAAEESNDGEPTTGEVVGEAPTSETDGDVSESTDLNDDADSDTGTDINDVPEGETGDQVETEDPGEVETEAAPELTTQQVEEVSTPINPANETTNDNPTLFQEESYTVGVEVRGLTGQRTGAVGVTVANEDGEVFTGTYNEYNQWTTDEGLPEGVYTITLDTPAGTFAEINTTTTNYAVPTDEENVFIIMVNEDNQGSSSAVYGAFRLVEVPVPDTYTVTIDPNGGTLNEDYRVLEATEGENFSLPFRFRLALENNGMSINGFNVDGVLINADGEQVDWIPDLSAYNYTVGSDVTLTTVWEETTAEFTVAVNTTDIDPGDYTVQLTNDEGTTFVLPFENTTSGSSGLISHNFIDEDFPRGTYTLSIDGFNITDVSIAGYQMSTQPELNDDGTATVYVPFRPNYGGNHARVNVDIEPIPEVATFPLGIEVRGLDNVRTDDVGVTVTNDDGEVFTGTYTQYAQWRSDTELPEGQYTITLDTPDGTTAVINETTTNHAVPTDAENVFTIMVNEDNLGSLSAVYGAFRLVEDVSTYQLGVEVRGLDGRRTDDVWITVTNEDNEVFEGAYNQYAQWLTENELPEGLYTITLNTPYGTIAEINDTTNQHAMPTDQQNVFTIRLNDENLGYGSSIYGAFNLIEAHPLGVEIRGLDGRRTDDVWVTVTDEDGEVHEGDYNQYLQWLSEDSLPAGLYTITLNTPAGTVAEINDTVATQAAEATDEENVFTILVNAENRGNLSSVYGAFRLVEVPEEAATYQLGVEVRGLDNRRTDDVWITVTDEDGEVYEGSYNQYLQWLTDEELPEGEYTITLNTPAGTVAEINDSTNQYAMPTDEENVFTILLNDENLGYGSSIYGAFRLVEVPEEVATYQLGVEVRGLNDRRTDEVDVTVTNNDGDVFEGSYNQYLQWLTDDELPEGEYTITLDTPAGTVAEINDTTNQYAMPTDEENVFTILLNDENLGYGSSIYGAFRLVEVPAEVETHRLGVEVRGLNDRRTDDVDIVVTNEDGDVFEGSFNEYLQWLTEEELPVGVYTITLTTPEGTVAVINETVATQRAVATDEDNVFTILVNEENRGSLTAVYGAFRLVEVPEEDNGDDDENGETPVEEEPEDELPGDDEEPVDDTDDDVDGDDVDDTDDVEDDEEIVVIADDLPRTGITGSSIGLGLSSILAGLGLLAINKKRKDD